MQDPLINIRVQFSHHVFISSQLIRCVLIKFTNCGGYNKVRRLSLPFSLKSSVSSSVSDLGGAQKRASER